LSGESPQAPITGSTELFSLPTGDPRFAGIMCFNNCRDRFSQLLNAGCEGGKTREVEAFAKTVFWLNILTYCNFPENSLNCKRICCPNKFIQNHDSWQVIVPSVTVKAGVNMKWLP